MVPESKMWRISCPLACQGYLYLIHSTPTIRQSSHLQPCVPLSQDSLERCDWGQKTVTYLYQLITSSRTIPVSSLLTLCSNHGGISS